MLDVQTRLPWYDSPWMNKYFSAREFLSAHNPTKLKAFDAAMDRLRTRQDFDVIEVANFLNDEQLQNAREVIKSVQMKDLEAHELSGFGRFVFHDHAFFNELQDNLTARVSALVGEEVEPNYNFLALYLGTGVCPVHMDSPEAKWTVDICIDQSEVWPISFSQIVPWPEPETAFGVNWQDELKTDPALGFQSRELKPGNALVFSGSSQFHYRNRIARGSGGNHCHLVFLHYVPKGTRQYVDPATWADFFGVPELQFRKP